MTTVRTEKLYTGVDGTKVFRADLEDNNRPGHLKRGLMLTPTMWLAACHFKLMTPRGDSLEIVQPAPDPFKPSIDEAPEELRTALADAEAQYKEAERIAADAGRSLDEAGEALGKFDDEYGTSLGGLTERGALRRKALDQEVKREEHQYREAVGLLDEARIVRNEAARKLDSWRRFERTRREAAAQEAERQKKGESKATLKDRITGFAKGLTA